MIKQLGGGDETQLTFGREPQYNMDFNQQNDVNILSSEMNNNRYDLSPVYSDSLPFGLDHSQPP